MAHTDTTEDVILIRVLKEKLARLDKQREAIRITLETMGESGQTSLFEQKTTPPVQEQGSLHARVIDAVVEHCALIGKSATVKDLLRVVESKGIDLGANVNKRAAIAGILSREISRKKEPRIRKVRRGRYDVAKRPNLLERPTRRFRLEDEPETIKQNG